MGHMLVSIRTSLLVPKTLGSWEMLLHLITGVCQFRLFHFYSFYLLPFVCEREGVCVLGGLALMLEEHTSARMWRSEDNFMESVLSFYLYGGPGV